MKTITFNGKDYAAKTWKELTGANWVTLSEGLSTLARADTPKAFRRAARDIVELLAPEVSPDFSGWTHEQILLFVFMLLPAMIGASQVFGACMTAVERMKRARFIRKVHEMDLKVLPAETEHSS